LPVRAVGMNDVDVPAAVRLLTCVRDLPPVGRPRRLIVCGGVSRQALDMGAVRIGGIQPARHAADEDEAPTVRRPAGPGRGLQRSWEEPRSTATTVDE